ncbi:Arc family DNA-binding protein [Salmonella enterica subsp. enterica serovar Essen]|nr:Arc family DNA-binding protein [Salmonella enterica subsp. enterica serovar Fufu]EDU3844882.1 Arc family DNA-binding protein [Salmonella enterica subsp. enterica serovar Essen]EJN2863895.1 Arc family DNA-binding protein [Salmonella enterica subsp. enterica serovar Yaba]HAK9055134.1 Arc family DNA-binding protein [Salmonella enterica]HCL5132401.1 Arc family DNA-binding protein [Salmonella enterica]
MKNARQMPQRKFRFPEEVIVMLEESASKNMRSTNAELIYRLKKSLEGEGDGQQ